MSKELETIKYLLEQCVNENIKKDLLDIKTTLEMLEWREKLKPQIDELPTPKIIFNSDGSWYYEGAKDLICMQRYGYEETQKKLKALEIIKEKKVAVNYLYYRAKFNAKEYNDNYIETITQEECELLKEVLL